MNTQRPQALKDSSVRDSSVLSGIPRGGNEQTQYALHRLCGNVRTAATNLTVRIGEFEAFQDNTKALCFLAAQGTVSSNSGLEVANYSRRLQARLF